MKTAHRYHSSMCIKKLFMVHHIYLIVFSVSVVFLPVIPVTSNQFRTTVPHDDGQWIQAQGFKLNTVAIREVVVI